jgi:mannose-6-phosphate isomerase-like protein (cupin superfamily)
MHPGEEIIYVLEGALEYQVEGKPPMMLKAGDVLFIPAGTVHAAKNVGGRRRRGTRHACSRKGEAAPHAAQVSAQ